MANKDFDLEDFSFDDFNFDEADIPGGTQPKNGRKPISEINSHFLQGMKETFTSESFLRRTAAEALPRGYGRAINTSYEAVGTAKELYNSAVEELKPAVDSLRYMTGKILPGVRKVLPAGLEKKLDDFAKDANNPKFALPSQGELDEQAINNSLQEIFKVSAAAQQKDREFQEARAEVREQIEDKKFKLGYGAQQHMRIGIDRLVAYQDQVTSQYQRKSLELQYRQFFALRDISDAIRRDGQVSLEYLKNITFNTSLPDIQKAKFSEVRHAMFEERIAGGINNAVSSYITSFIPKLKDRILSQGKGFLSGVSSGLSSGRSAMELADSAGLSGAGLFGSVMGQGAAEELGYRGAQYLRGRTNKVAGVRRFGNWLDDRFGDIPEKLNRYGRTPTQRTGLMGFLESVIKGVVPTYSPNLSAGASPLARLDQAAQFTNHTQRSITEVIPGYLARILREVTAARTGDPNTPLTVWSVDRGQFVTEKSAMQDAMHRMFHPAQVKAFRETNRDLMKRLDPNGNLTKKQQELMRRQHAIDAASGLPFDPSMWMEDGFRIVGASQADHDAIVGHLRDHYQIPEGAKGVDPKNEAVYDRYRGDKEVFGRMRSVMPDPNEIIRVYGQAGQMDLLRKLGFVTKNGFNDVIDADKLFAYLMESEQSQMHGGHGGPGGGKSGGSGGSGGSGHGPRRGGGGYNPRPGSGGPKYLEHGKLAGKIRDAIPSGSTDHVLVPKADEDPFDRIARDIDATYDRIDSRLQGTLNMAGKLEERLSRQADIHQRATNITDDVLAHEERERNTATLTRAEAAGTTKTMTEQLIDVLQAQGQAIVEQLTSGTIATESKTQTEDLDQILHLLKTRNFVIGGGTGPDGDADFGPESPNDPPEVRLARRLLKMRNAARAGGKKAWDAAGRLGKWGRGKATAGWAGLGNLWTKAKATAQEWKDMGLDMAEDLYVRGMKSPILEYAKLKAGEYFDENGKPIHKWSDIKGAVYDRSGKVVCDAKQVARGFYDRHGKRILSTVTAAVMRGLNAIANAWQPARWAQSIKNLGKRALDSVRNFVDQPVDIYVRGEDKPRLRAVIMEAGGYFSARTGQPIKRPSQIDGEVKNERGDTVISLEDFDKGLVNVFGLPVGSLKTVARRLVSGTFRRGRALVMRAIQAGKDLGKKGLNLVTNSFKTARDWVTGKVNFGFGGMETYKEVAKQTTILERIYKLLDDRLPGRRVLGDNNSDGVRDGSFLAELKHDRGEGEGEAGGGGKDGGPGGGFGGFGAAAEWFKRKFGKDKDKDKDKDDDDDDGDSFGEDMAEDWLERKLGKKMGKWWRKSKLLGKKGWRGAKNLLKGGAKKLPGKLGKLGKWGGKLLGLLKGARFATGAAGVAGAAETAAAGTGLATTAAAGTGLATTGALSAEALASAGMGAEILGGSLAAEAGGGILAGLAGLLSAPVLLGIGAVALVGYGGYKLYRHFHDKIGPLEKVRMAQYGIPLTDASKYNTVRNFEQLLLPQVSYDSNGNAKVDMTKIEMKKVLGVFGIDPMDGVRVRRFGEWFVYRFKPVFLTHLTALHKINGKVALPDVDGDSLKPQEKMTYLQTINVPESTYVRGSSPFDAKELLDTHSQDVDNAIADARKELEKGGAKLDKKLAVAQAAAIAAKEHHPSSRMAIDSLRPHQGGFVPSPISPAAMKLAQMGGAAVSVQSNALLPIGPLDRSGLSALTAIRLKAYGMTEMSGTMARSLITLERMVVQNLDVRPGSKTTFKGNPNEFFNQFGQLFAIRANDEVRKKLWLDWFTLRFVPVVVQYINTVKAMNPSANESMAEAQLSPLQRQAVAQAVIGTTTTVDNAKVSVWEVRSSPFLDKSINTDARSTDGNMELINADADKQKLTDPTGKGKGYDASKSTTTKAPKTPSASAGNHPSAKMAVPTIQGKGGYNPTVGASPSLSNFHGPAAHVAGSAVGFSKGLGGTIRGMANAVGKGWAAVKNVIIQAARMVGIDPSVLATFANIESGFDPNARAGTSSAAGLFQFINSTWKALVNKYGAQFGIDPQTPKTDPRASAIMGALYLRDNAQILQKATGRAPTAAELYMAHLLGPGTAAKLLSAPEDATVDAVVSRDAMTANRSLFFGRGGRPLTIAAFVQEMESKIASKGGWNTGAGDNLKSGVAGHEFQRHAIPGAVLGKVGMPGMASNDPAPGVTPIGRDFSARRQSLGIPPSGPMADHLAGRGGVPGHDYNPAPTPHADLMPVTMTPIRMGDDRKLEQVRRSQQMDRVVGEVTSRQRHERQASALDTLTDLASKNLKVNLSMDQTLKQISTQLGTLTQLTGKQLEAAMKGGGGGTTEPNQQQTPLKPTKATTALPSLPVSVSRKAAS